MHTSNNRQIASERPVRLTQREAEVLNHIVCGHSNQWVADALHVSKRTIDTHVTNLYGKLAVSNRLQVFFAASRLGLIPQDADGMPSVNGDQISGEREDRPAAEPIHGTILVAEDDLDDQTLIVRSLRRAGAEGAIHLVQDGVEARAYLEGPNARPAVIIADLKMPKIGGLELLEFLRSDEELSAIPLVLLSSSMNPLDKDRALALGAHSFFLKPYTSLGLEETLRTIRHLWDAKFDSKN